MRKYIGISIDSQNTKKRNRSREQNTPNIAVSSARSDIIKPLNPFSIELHAARIHTGVRNVVSNTNHNEIPSIPIW